MVGEDIFSGVAGAIGGFNTGASSTITGLLMMIQLPLMVVWVILTIGVVYMIFLRKTVFLLPWDFKLKITLVRPFAGLKMGVFQDRGVLLTEAGIKRMQLKNERVIMPKPDTTDSYVGGELIVVSLGPDKKFSGKRLFDYENKKVIIDVESPKVAQLYFCDKVVANNPNWFFDRFQQIGMVLMLWVYISLMVAVSNFLVLYPMFVHTAAVA